MADTNDIQKRRAALLASFGVNPDEVAEINRKAASLKVPVGVVKEMPQTANTRMKLNEIEAQVGGLSILPQRLSDQKFSDLSHDDIGELSEIERKAGVLRAAPEDGFFTDIGKSLKRGWLTAEKNFNGMFMRSDVFGLNRQREAAAKANGVYYNRELDIAHSQAKLQRDIDRYAPDATLQKQQRGLAEQKTLAGAAGYLVKNPTLLLNTSAESLGQNALGLAAGLATGGIATIGTVGASSGAQEYAATMEEMLNEHAHELGGMTETQKYAYALTRQDWMDEAKKKAWKRGISIGLFDAATAGLAGRLLGGATGKLSAAARTAGEAGIQAGGGAAGEATAQALTGEYKPGDIIMEAFAELPTGAFEARSNYKSARAKVEERAAQVQAAEQARARLKEQAQAVTNSRLTKRAPDVQASYVNDVYADNQKIYFDGGALMQSGRAAAVAQAMPDMAARIQEAAETGGMVEMTRGDFHARLTQEDQNALAEIAMETPDSMTAAEAEEIRKSGFDAMMDEAYQADLARHQEEQAQEEQARRVAEFEAFKEEVKAQLTATGIMDGAQAEANATLYTRAVEALAGRLNMGIRDFDAAYGGLNVVGESLIDDGVLNQSASAMKSTEANMQRGRDAMNKALIEKADQKRAMYRSDTGWIDFVWGSEGVLKANGKTKGAMGLAHIIESRMRKDGMSYQDVAEMLTMQITDTIAKGGSSRIYSNGKSESMFIEHNGYRATLVRNKGSNGWLMNAFELHQGGDTGKSNDSKAPTHDQTTRHRSEVGAPDVLNNFTQDADANQDLLYQGGTDRGMFSRENNLIALLKNADASTFVHELGHFFLETNTRIARDLTAKPAENLTEQERQFLSDVQTALDWFGVKDLAAWDAMSLNEQRENHEKWARGFEAYLYEGKAPSEELRGVFRRFRSWLKQVYQSLKNLNVELTDEVRSVFDRMFASDEQIQQAQYINGMTPMFEDAAQAGMDDADYAQYRHNAERATAEAQDDLTARALRDMAFIRNLRARKIREMRKQYKADFQRAEMAARGSIMRQPVYRAWQLLTARITEENRIGDGKPKFSKQVDAAHDSLFEAIAKLGGVNKDEMISQFGLDPKDKIPAVHIGYPVLRKTNGRSIDGMIEALTEEGYLPVDDTGKADPRDFEERFFDEMRGNKRYSSAYVPHEQKAGDHVANPYALTAVRFDHDSLVAMGVDGLTLERLIDFDMTRKNGGMHPDLVSDLILNEDGEPVFSGGEDLIRALTEAQPPQEAIEETAYLNVLAEKGEVPTQADFEEAADLAAHSEIRQRIIAAEFKALSKATGASNLIRKAASVYAQEKVEQIKVRDLRPSVYTRAEAKAAKASMEAFRKGDIPTAATQKRNQLLQNSMAREVLKAREEMETARKYLSKFNRVVKSIDIEYREQIEALLESVELSNAPSLKDLDKRTSLLQFVKKMEEQGRAHNIDAEYIAEIQAKRNYREMTVEEMRVLVDTVKGIEHLGRLKNKMLTARDKRTYQEIRDNIVESIRENARTHDKRTSTAANNIERVEDGFSGFMWGHIKISSIARILDGGKDAGAFWNYFIRPINEAADREATMTAETAQKLEEILKPLNDNLTHREYWRNAEYQIGGQKFTRRQLFAIALNMGNEGNIQRLLSGGHGSVRNWNMTEVMDAMQNLTSKEWQAVQKVWDLFESFRPQIAELERKVVGIEPQWVEPKPLTVRTADGEMLTLRGGYYPAKYDPASTQAAESGNALSDIEDIKSAVKMAANTRHSFTKDRAAAVENRPLLLDLSVTYNGLNEIIHDLTHREAVIDAARLLKSSSIDKAIRETLGAQAKQKLNKALEDIARGNTAPVNGLDKYSGLLRQNVSMTGLGFNIVSAAVQVTGFIPAVARLGGKYAWAGLSQYTTHPIKATQSAMEQSEFMRNRGNTRLREIREVAATINGAGKIRKFLNKYSYWLMMKMQQVVDTAIWHGALAKAMDSGKDLDTAIKLADQTVLDTQGGGQIKDLSEFERGSNTKKLFTVFYAYMNTALNQGFVEVKTQKSKAKLAADLMMIYVVPTALTALMKSALIPGDDDDDLAKKLAKEQISFLLGLFVFGREMTQLANIATGDRFYGYAGPSGLRPIDDGFKFVQQAVQGEFDSTFVRASVNLLGDAFGLPSAQINRTIKGAEALQDDETDNPAALLMGHQGN
jgi:bbp10|nr:MAG TPA: crystallin beta/gamma motif-containing protein [Caudoviricetes sp.]